MQTKYQIFVSSTFKDLADERQDAIRSILDLGHIPAGMELFPAADSEQLVYIKKVIDECDYYILIIGGRYGSLDNEGISFTEREYDYAVETNKTILAFPHGDIAAIPFSKSEPNDRMRNNLASFRDKVMSGRLVREWRSREQLESVVIKSIVHATSNYPAIGWVRGNVAASEDLLQEINNLRLEARSLKRKNDELSELLQPLIPNLASGDEKIILKFHYTARFNGKTSKEYRAFELSWNEIFKAIASEINSPKSTSLVSSYINSFLSEVKGETRFYVMNDIDVAVVKNQLSSLGLINVYVGRTIKDNAAHEFMKLTELGKARIKELLAIKSASSL